MKSWILLLASLPAAGQNADQCLTKRWFTSEQALQDCAAKLIQSRDAWHRAEGFWKVRRWEDANNQFKAAIAAEPRNPDIRARWGRLFLERFNKKEAQNLFGEALEINEKHPGALLGMALIASDGFESKAVEFAAKALESDPKLVEAQELLARLALEDNNPEKAAAEADKALKLDPQALDAMAIHQTIDWLADRKTSEWMDRILKINPRYGEAYAIAGHFLVLNRRYEEGIAYYRKALELDPSLNEARSQLGVNLMRLGEEKEAREQLARAFDSGQTDALTANTLKLIDSYKNFQTVSSSGMVLKLHKKESDLLRPFFEKELKRAIDTFERKYKMKLSKPVQLEVYPDHEDFAVRTLGMPGLGALGVTFGHVVAMDSPSGRRPGSFHWASTLWHELSHVFVLTATNHRVPRWFTEGMAVHEETAASSDWGDRLDPEAINAIKTKKLLPVAQLDRGFIRPSYPNQVIVSYFQAGRICDYIAQKWNYDKLLDMMHSFGKGLSTSEVVEKHLAMKPEEFDQQFLAWLEAQTKRQVDNLAEWRKQMKALAEAANAKRHDDVIRIGTAMRDLYPDYVEAGSVYEQLASAYEARNDKAAALKQLEDYSRIGGRNPASIKKLATLLEEAGRPKDAANALQRLIYIYPVEEELHRRLGDLWLAQGNLDGAIMEFGAVVAAKPIDEASARFKLASALHKANRLGDAKDQLFMALEAAPGYKPAQRLLLELSTTEIKQ